MQALPAVQLRSFMYTVFEKLPVCPVSDAVDAPHVVLPPPSFDRCCLSSGLSEKQAITLAVRVHMEMKT